MAFRLSITFTGKHGDVWKVGCDKADIQDDVFRCFIKENQLNNDCCTYNCVFESDMSSFKTINVSVRELHFGRPFKSFEEIKFELQPGEKIPDHISGNLQAMHDVNIINTRILELVEITGKYDASWKELAEKQLRRIIYDL
jgi:hypothetical protein